MQASDAIREHIAEAAELHNKASSALFEAKFDLVLAPMDANHAALMHAITIDQRLKKLAMQAEAKNKQKRNTGIHSLRSE
jgi:hypothetical protein